VELVVSDGVDHLLVKHQIRHVRCRDDDALFAGQPLRLAGSEEAFDLGCNAANGLNLAVLIDRAGDRDPLWIGRPDSAESSAYSSVDEAESPSTSS